MNTTLQKNKDTGLRFFGKVTASVTHDVKNSLATINENAGLLTDYAAMAARGKPLDPERVNALAVRIMDQVKRADALLKNMNRFAHSVDDSLKKVDLNEIRIPSPSDDALVDHSPEHLREDGQHVYDESTLSHDVSKRYCNCWPPCRSGSPRCARRPWMLGRPRTRSKSKRHRLAC